MRILSLDLEVGKRGGRIHALAAVYGDGPAGGRSRRPRPGGGALRAVVRTERAPWELATVAGRTVGRLAENYRATGVLHSARVHAIVTWGRQDSEPQYRGSLQCERWEVVVPEFVFETGP